MIRRVGWLLAFGLPMVSVLALAKETGVAPSNGSLPARIIVDQYLQAPLPVEGNDPGYQVDRVIGLSRVSEVPPDEAITAISAGLSSATHVVHRIELLEVLRRITIPAAADVFVRYSEDSDPRVRREAVLGLRVLASRIRRSGLRASADPQFAPKVEGLVPYLLEAAHDEDEQNRKLALWALADSRDSVALRELRHALLDPAPRVRFDAAVLLAEVNDDSGLPELRRMLEELMEDSRASPGISLRYLNTEALLVSFELLTGISLGEIPGAPLFYSCAADGEKAAATHDLLLQRWAKWWSRHPELKK